MRSDPKPGATADALAYAYEGITAAVDGRPDDDLLRPTRCRGWLVTDLMQHLLLDAQRALVALATPAAGPADVDHAGYWARYPGAGDAGAANAHATWVRRAAAAYPRPSGVLAGWRDTAPAAVRAARAADPVGHVATQGHVLTVPDFLATLVTEAVVHHLDLVVDLTDAAPPGRAATDVALSTLEALAGGLPDAWGDVEALLKGTGRKPLTDGDRRLLGAAAERFPLLA
jgi:uncharacterized protein (TIGR03083 family)